MNCVITGGAGFVGTNLAHSVIEKGHTVTILGSLSRKGAESKLKLFGGCTAGERVPDVKGDVRDRQLLDDAVNGHQVVFRLAAQVAVTRSLWA